MRITNPYLRNLFFAVDEIRTNPLAHLFTYIILAFGICFAFLADPSGASSTLLYRLTVANLGYTWINNIWGLVAMTTGVLNVAAYLFRRKWLGTTVSYMGFGTWAYAFFIFAMGGVWFNALAIAFPNILFWAWHFIAVNKYYELYTSGINPTLKIPL